jgi:sugar lactone lactonase YvrE
MLPAPETLVDRLAMPEAPRWHAGEFYFSNVWAGQVLKVGKDGRPETIAEFPAEYTSGLGFLPDGDMLTVLMSSRRVMRTTRGRATVHADLKPFADFLINDMVVDRQGRAYVSQLGYDMWAREANYKSTEIILIEADGRARVAARETHCPNGMAISPDGLTLFVAESAACRVTTFAIDKEGELSDRRVFGQLAGGGTPDGICLDDSGGVWVGVPVSIEQPGGYGFGVQRVIEGGAVTHTVPVGEDRRALACVFGDDDRRSLYICTGDSHYPEAALLAKKGRIERIRLDFRGAGRP